MASDGKNRADGLLEATYRALAETRPLRPGERPLVGVDLGTASIVLVALDSAGRPAACELERAAVVRDGLMVDYFGAMEIVGRLKTRLEERLGTGLCEAAIAVPPGTGPADAGAHRNVVEACGLEVTAVVDEPTAAGEVLRVRDGVVVDIGGGTTGLTVFRGGKAVYTADEPTGGTHVSLVLMGAHGISFEEAEERKRTPTLAAEVLGVVKPVIEKMAAIVAGHVRGMDVGDAWLVGGTCALPSMDRIFQQASGLRTHVPPHPMLVTPLGIALSARSAAQAGEETA